MTAKQWGRLGARSALSSKQQSSANALVRSIKKNLKRISAVLLLIALGSAFFAVTSAVVASSQAGYIAKWNVAGTWRGSSRWGGLIRDDPLNGEAIIRPIVGRPVYGASRPSWRPMSANGTAYVDFTDSGRFGNFSSPRIAYAFAHVYRSSAQTVNLKIAANGGVVVWLNGRRVLIDNRDLSTRTPRVIPQVVLNAGWNRLLIKIGQSSRGEWGFSARVYKSGNQAVTFSNDHEGPVVKPGYLNWQVATAGQVLAAPSVSGASVYAGDEAGKLWGLNSSTGAQRWAPRTVSGPIRKTVLVTHVTDAYLTDETIVAVADLEGHVSARKTSNGSLLWDTVATTNGAPIVGGVAGRPDTHITASGSYWGQTRDLLFVGTYSSFSNSVAALRADNGALVWRYSSSDAGRIAGTPAVDEVDGILYFGAKQDSSGDPTLWAIDARSGKLLWRTSVPGSISSSPVMDPAGDYVYVGTDSGKVYKYESSANYHDPTWVFNSGTGKFVYGFSRLVDNHIYVSIPAADRLYDLIDQGGGVTVNANWGGSSKGYASVSSPGVPVGVMALNQVYVGSEGKLVELDADTGAQTDSFAVSQVTFGDPALDLDNDRVVVGGDNGFIYSLDLGLASTP